jgi:hypothetical protein
VLFRSIAGGDDSALSSAYLGALEELGKIPRAKAFRRSALNSPCHRAPQSLQ